MINEWKGFKEGIWTEEINVRDFIQKNYEPYLGDDEFLAEASEKTEELWKTCEGLLKKELENGVLDVDTKHISGINNFEPGYIKEDVEVIKGLQTDAPLKRIMNPFGGLRMVEESLESYGYEADPGVLDPFKGVRKTHNQGVFDAYTDEIRALRSAGLLTGLPDAYGRGRIIGDYRRIPLYGISALIEAKKADKKLIKPKDEESIRRREELQEEIRALDEINQMALTYGVDMCSPAKNAYDAFQFVYLGYLAGVKENNGAAMSLGRVSSFLDIYIERDLADGSIDEKAAQELVDQFIIKLRMIRHLRTPEYNELFAGDPNWVTESIGGMGIDGRTLVTKNSLRFLHSLTNLGPAPEPNMTVLWSEHLPENFKKYCAKMSIDTASLQYENDDIMQPIYGDDYAIACCVSAMGVGKEMQFFGARCNLAKSLLYAINGGIDEKKKKEVIAGITPIDSEVLDYEEVKKKYFEVLSYVAEKYVDSMNIIHYMHDKYAYEKSQMALHDTDIHRYMAFGVAGLSVAADSLSAIKYARVSPVRENGLALDFKIDGDYPMYGNDDDRVDNIAVEIATYFMKELRKHETYRNAEQTLSALTITSNVVYGKKTGATPDGREAEAAFAPGANPMHGRDTNGALASLNSVAKIPYRKVCQDGVSNTFSIVPDALGRDQDTRENNLVSIIDGYCLEGGHHLNVNVFYREKLLEAMENPEKFPHLTIRVSGYAVHFNRLTREQQEEVIRRTFHNKMAGC